MALDPAVELEEARTRDAAWREDRRERFAISLRRLWAAYGRFADFLALVGLVAFLVIAAAVVLMTVAETPQERLRLMKAVYCGLAVIAGTIGLGGTVWLAVLSLDRFIRFWARQLAMDLEGVSVEV